MGGTTADAYQNINVFNSANKRVKGGCGNGAVLFEVTGGTAEGAFMVYTNPNASTLNESEYVTDCIDNDDTKIAVAFKYSALVSNDEPAEIE